MNKQNSDAEGFLSRLTTGLGHSIGALTRLFHPEGSKDINDRAFSLAERSGRGTEGYLTSVARGARPGHCLRIAALDDNEAILDLLEALLTVDGHTLVRYELGETLLHNLLPPSSINVETYIAPYDVIILDLLLPGKLSGVDVFLTIRNRFTAEQLPIIVITAVDESTLEQFRRILPDDVPLLHKPFRPYMLQRLIAQLSNGEDL
jgi:CheY-like chemotaxis protein